VGCRPTTRCCSALALAAVWFSCLAIAAAQRPEASRRPEPKRSGNELPLSPFPSRTHYTLALNNQLVAGPAYAGHFGYFPIEGDRIVAYDLEAGSQRWIVPAKPQGPPVVGGDLLLVAQEGSLMALRTPDGSTAWTTPFPEPLVVRPVSDRERFVVVTASEIVSLEAADGVVAWRHAVAGARAAPAIEADRLYQSLDDGRVIALRTDTGAQVWERKIGGTPNAILARGDRLFVGSTDNFFYGLKTEDGLIDWRLRTGADVVSEPIAEGDRVYFVSLDNVLRAVNRRNGVQFWKKSLPFRPTLPPLKAADAVVVAGSAAAARAYFLKIVVTRSIAEGATVMAVSRTIDPQATLFSNPLPNLIPVRLRP
jgi:outer membrane protein assembly factor BamB